LSDDMDMLHMKIMTYNVFYLYSYS
jgi:hypothetical protein